MQTWFWSRFHRVEMKRNAQWREMVTMYVNHEILENSIGKWTENLGNPIGNEMKIEITGN